MLAISNLSKTYANGVHALRGINLNIERGLFGLLGPNGAGKSSLMRTLATLQTADSGEVRLDDVDVLAEPKRVRQLLGYLPQEFGLYPRIDAATLLDHFACLKGIDDAGERAQSVEALLRLTNLWDVRKQKLGTYSGGMKQRFGISQAMLGRPQLIIVDEPTNGLDPEERRRFLNLLARIGEDAVVILSTHLVADVRELCSAMAVMDKGCVLAHGEPKAMMAEIEGQVWQREIEPTEAELLADGVTLLSTNLNAGRTVARVHSPNGAPSGFRAAEANLEDVYFAALRKAA